MAHSADRKSSVSALLPKNLHAAALVLSGTIVALALLGVTGLVHFVGDPSTALLHLFYIPILYAAARHGFGAATTTALSASALISPWLWEGYGATDALWLSEWLTRSVMFTAVGMTAAWFARQQPRPFDQLLRDTVVGAALARALRNSAITVHFQPVFNMKTNKVTGVEALARWPKASGGYVPPNTFVPVAEREGVNGPLRRAVLSQSVTQALDWASEGQKFVLAVNISAVDLTDKTFMADVSLALSRLEGSGVKLCLELTETALLADPEAARSVLGQVRALGGWIALDDFGTGQSSLAYLTSLPIDVIKIDKTFVQAAVRDDFSRAAVEAVVHLAAVLGARTVAEGIETRAHLDLAKELGCDLAQGFMLGLPVPGSQLEWDAQLHP